MTAEVKTKRMSYEEFTNKAIKALRDEAKSKGINTVFSGYNQAMKVYYGDDLEKEKETISIKGSPREFTGASVLAKMGIASK